MASKKIFFRITIILTICSVFLTGFSLHTATILPVTGSTSLFQAIAPRHLDTINTDENFIALSDFISSVKSGNAASITGVYVNNKLAFPVVQQPKGQPGYVSTKDGITTQFGMANAYDVIGMLAHNYLAGKKFFDLKIGDEIVVVSGNGSTEKFTVTEIKKYQALSPNSASSNFVDLSNNETISASELFSRVYTGKHHLTMQTCIQEGKVDSWGRLFVLAVPSTSNITGSTSIH
ncbi:MAG: hypothetical protein HGA53_02365 [Anaerolineaceae bacterium]|nr:hypothetical protein [Anaerolineaceae bacterium]